MNIVIRVDASLNIGTGHCFRMMTLATELQKRGHNIIFFSRDLKGNIISRIKDFFNVVVLDKPSCSYTNNKSFGWLEVDYAYEISEIKAKLQSLKLKVDRLIVDSYSIDYKWHTAMKDYVSKVIQIDDLDNRKYECNVVIDQNIYRNNNRYILNTSKNTKVFCGSEYAMLRPAFIKKRKELESYRDRYKKNEVVVFFGGVDIKDETSKLLKKIAESNLEDKFNIVLGESNPRKHHIQNEFDNVKKNIKFHVAINNIEEVFARSYIFIGAVGSTTWERCSLKLPGIVSAVAENQIDSAETLNLLNGHFYLGLSENVQSKKYLDTLKSLKKDFTKLELQSIQCGKLCDGRGVSRVADIVEN